jgi:Protein of unknown function (DUF2971)
MRAYKFRRASQADRIFDILINNRLYCAELHDLNDPVEGIFAHTCSSDMKHQARDFSNEVQKVIRDYRICSLAGTYDCHLLWSHYADGFNGVAIELDLPDHHPNLKQVVYRGVFAFIRITEESYSERAAEQVLFSKYSEWSYEREIRIISEDQWHQLERPVRRVIAGHRIAPPLFDALQLVCETLNIEIGRIGIGDEGLDVDRVPPSRLLQPNGRAI